MNIIARNARNLLAASLSFCIGFSGIGPVAMPGFGVRLAEAANSVIRITESGPGARQRIKLGLNKAVVIDLPEDAHDILVADPTLADAVTRTSRRIYLFGKTVGQTNIFVFGTGGQEIVSLEIEIERDITGLESNLRRFLPDSDIKVEIVSDNIVLTGTVQTPQDAAQAVALARAFIKGGEATTRNITVSGSEGGTGDIFAESRQQSQIVNMLKIQGEDQVTLKVTVAEVSRQVLKQLGFSGVLGRGNDQIAFRNPTNLGNAINPLASRVLSTIGSASIETYVNAMEQAGVMRTLAEPSLTAISGQQAKFYVGGEYRLPSSQEITTNADTGSRSSAAASKPWSMASS